MLTGSPKVRLANSLDSPRSTASRSVGERLRLGLLVGVALQLRARVDLVLDSVEPRSEQRGVAQVGVHIGARDAALGAARLAVADDAEPAGAIVATPRDRRRRPALGGIALVGVDRGRDEQRQLADVVAHAAQVVAEDVGLLLAVHEALWPSRTRLEWMWHELPMSFSEGLAMNVAEILEEGDLLHAVLVDRVTVGRGDRVGVARVHLVLAVPGLALRELDRDPAPCMPRRIGPRYASSIVVARMW